MLVPARATAAEARRLLHVRKARLRVVPLAARPAFRPEAAAGAARERERLGLGRAVRGLRRPLRRPPGPADAVRRARRARRGAAARRGRRDGAVAAARVPRGRDARRPRRAVAGGRPRGRRGRDRLRAASCRDERLAALVAGARFLVQPVRSEATGLAALDALAAGVPVVASAIGRLPEVVGPAGDPRRAGRPGAARDGDPGGLVGRRPPRAARRRGPGACATTRTWADVARETRAAWADVARPAPLL